MVKVMAATATAKAAVAAIVTVMAAGRVVTAAVVAVRMTIAVMTTMVVGTDNNQLKGAAGKQLQWQ